MTLPIGVFLPISFLMNRLPSPGSTKIWAISQGGGEARGRQVMRHVTCVALEP